MARGRVDRMTRRFRNNTVQNWFYRFAKAGISEPFLSAKRLAEHTARGNTIPSRFTPEQKQQFELFCAERMEFKPVQYICGDWDFYNLRNIKVRSPVLIPRPETEVLVKSVVDSYSESPSMKANFLEVGSGSGCISLALLSALPHLTGWAIDIDPKAVELTRENAKLFNLHERLSVVECDVRNFRPTELGFPNEFLFCVSNPPYLETLEWVNLIDEQLRWESRQSLDGGQGGRAVIDGILRQVPKYLTLGGVLFFECDTQHPPKLENEKWDDLEFVRKFADLRGCVRFCEFKKI